MKKIIPFGVMVFLLSCHSPGHLDADSPMPSISILLPDSTSFKTDQLEKGRYTVIMYFRPDCSHCQQETADIIKSLPDLQSINFVFLTLKPLKDLREYVNVFKLSGYKNILAGSDNKKEFLKYYNPPNVPFLAVYDKQKRLYRIAEGPLPVDSLKVLNNL